MIQANFYNAIDYFKCAFINAADKYKYFPLLCLHRETALYGNLMLKKGVIPAELLQ